MLALVAPAVVVLMARGARPGLCPRQAQVATLQDELRAVREAAEKHMAQARSEIVRASESVASPHPPSCSACGLCTQRTRPLTRPLAATQATLSGELQREREAHAATKQTLGASSSSLQSELQAARAEVARERESRQREVQEERARGAEQAERARKDGQVRVVAAAAAAVVAHVNCAVCACGVAAGSCVPLADSRHRRPRESESPVSTDRRNGLPPPTLLPAALPAHRLHSAHCVPSTRPRSPSWSDARGTHRARSALASPPPSSVPRCARARRCVAAGARTPACRSTHTRTRAVHATPSRHPERPGARW